jgi:flagellar biosynthesis protein FlhA
MAATKTADGGIGVVLAQRDSGLAVGVNAILTILFQQQPTYKIDIGLALSIEL